MTTVDLIVLLLLVALLMGLLAGIVFAVYRYRQRSTPPPRPEPAPPAPAPSRAPPSVSAPRPGPTVRPTPEPNSVVPVEGAGGLPPLSEPDRQRYVVAWESVQHRFLDSPVLALSQADALLAALLVERGLPSDGLRTQADLPRLPGARVLDDFRAGHLIEQANSTRRADLDQIRKGLVHFQLVFSELVGVAAQPYPAGDPFQQPGRSPDRPTRRDRPASR